ncbi:uncharacterized protein LOC129593878 isoform X2 [Paramacrobiotus metropolitanus]|uniref:uncharacterized protein LOC129593878 isoform X2 n=1 Tax=Paramacrobiotus metropolitanus TaxID=2943436 RepID=UPI002445EB74|nr:uncharacterized protein LOC129593878 isoform X2 [Paramacrobiotus metropolitanus]
MQPRCYHPAESRLPDVPAKSARANLHCDIHYLISGILKIVELILTLNALALTVSTKRSFDGESIMWANVSIVVARVAAAAFISTLFLFGLKVLRYTKEIQTELGYCIVEALSLLAAATFMIPYRHLIIDYMRLECALFCAAAVMVYQVDAFLIIYRVYRSRQLAQPSTVIVTSDKKKSSAQRCCYPGALNLPDAYDKSPGIAAEDPDFSLNYLKKLSGFSKISELVFTLGAFVLSIAIWSLPPLIEDVRELWTNVATAVSHVTTLALFVMYLLRIVDEYHTIPGTNIELAFCMVEVLCLLSAGAAVVPYRDMDFMRLTCAFFCWAAMIAYLTEAFLIIIFRMHPSHQSAQVYHMLK